MFAITILTSLGIRFRLLYASLMAPGSKLVLAVRLWENLERSVRLSPYKNYSQARKDSGFLYFLGLCVLLRALFEPLSFGELGSPMRLLLNVLSPGRTGNSLNPPDRAVRVTITDQG